jgi:phospholipase C
MKPFLLFLAFTALLSVAVTSTQAAKVPPGPIKHFVVLMMENRAFDHMLGWQMEQRPDINGINGTESNPWDINNPNGRQIFVNKLAKDVREGISISH